MRIKPSNTFIVSGPQSLSASSTVIQYRYLTFRATPAVVLLLHSFVQEINSPPIILQHPGPTYPVTSDPANAVMEVSRIGIRISTVENRRIPIRISQLPHPIFDWQT